MIGQTQQILFKVGDRVALIYDNASTREWGVADMCGTVTAVVCADGDPLFQDGIDVQFDTPEVLEGWEDLQPRAKCKVWEQAPNNLRLLEPR